MNFIIILTLLISVCMPFAARADGCYICREGGYVRHLGDDTFEKRKKAAKEFGCTVSGTSHQCTDSQTKGMVSLSEKEMKENR